MSSSSSSGAEALRVLVPDRQDAVEARAELDRRVHQASERRGVGAAAQHRPPGARDLSEAAAVERHEPRGQLVGEVHLRGGAQLAGARVQAREQGVRAAGDGGRVLHHARVDLVQVERGGHRRRRALQPQLVAGALALGLEQARPLERHRREVGEPLDHRQLRGSERVGLVERGHDERAERPADLAPHRAHDHRRGAVALPHALRRAPRRARRRSPPSGRAPPPRRRRAAGEASGCAASGGSDASTATCRSSFANQPAGGAGARLVGLDRYEGHGRHGQDGAQVRHEALRACARARVREMREPRGCEGSGVNHRRESPRRSTICPVWTRFASGYARSGSAEARRLRTTSQTTPITMAATTA